MAIPANATGDHGPAVPDKGIDFGPGAIKTDNGYLATRVAYDSD
jgi:hypothetical protein